MKARIVLGLILVLGAVFWLTKRPASQTPSQQPTPIPSLTKVAPSLQPEDVSKPGDVAPPPAASPTASSPTNENSAGPVSDPPPTPRPLTASSTAPPAPSPSGADLRTQLEEVQVMLREYRTALGGNPVGTNAEIMRAINGDNLKQLKVGPPAGQQLNDQGELVDRWDTPYFFHQVSRDRMEIRSAGPDRVMWTADDQQM